MSGLRLEGVAKSYDGAPALRPLDLAAADGELVVVLGPTPCGKSTQRRLVVLRLAILIARRHLEPAT